MSTLAYFDMFDYPVTRKELMEFSAEPLPPPSVDALLKQLLCEKKVFRLGEFYSLQDNPDLAKRRLLGNSRAAGQLVIAAKVAQILSWLPYVESIAISGSLSKNYSEKESDIDFFIITSANRLWVARTFMHLLKKVTYLAGLQKWFCMNYYVDQAEMEIIEKNVFTAMEIITLIPVRGLACFQHFLEANRWTQNYFHRPDHPVCVPEKTGKPLISKWVENLFRSGFGDRTDRWLMKLTDSRWKRKSQKGRRNNHGSRMGMRVDRHYSKPDPSNYQETLIGEYERRLRQLLPLPLSKNSHERYIF